MSLRPRIAEPSNPPPVGRVYPGIVTQFAPRHRAAAPTAEPVEEAADKVYEMAAITLKIIAAALKSTREKIDALDTMVEQMTSKISRNSKMIDKSHDDILELKTENDADDEVLYNSFEKIEEVFASLNKRIEAIEADHAKLTGGA